MTGVAVLQSLIFAALCVTALAALRIAGILAQLCVFGLMVFCGVWQVVGGLLNLEAGRLLAGLMLLALTYGLDAVFTDLRRAEAAAVSPPGQAPGGAHAPGEAGKRDGERDAPILPGEQSTAGCAGRPRSFLEVSR